MRVKLSMCHWLVRVGLMIGLLVAWDIGVSPAAEPKAGAWSGGAGVGFLGNTPDGTAFAANVNAEYFLTQQLSIGPLAQIAATGDLFQFGFSGQAKYWLDLSGLNKRLKMNVQGGIGFLHSDLFTSDDSWLIPIGLGLDYALNQSLSVTSTFLLNFADVHTGRGTDAHVMPGLTFGVRF